MDKIIELEINNFEKCNNIWNMDKNIDHKNKIYNVINKISIFFRHWYRKKDKYC